jgi:N-acetylmuramoyl-L-alanine amidase
MVTVRRLALVGLSLAAACGGGEAGDATTRWPMPHVAGPLRLEVRHPVPGAPRPPTGRDYVMGSTGHGDAIVHVNGTRAAVRRNGSFLAYTAAPERGGVHTITAEVLGQRAAVALPVGSAESPVSVPAPVSAAAPSGGSVAIVPAGNTLGAGPGDVAARAEPDGDYVWFLLPGTRGEVVAAQGSTRRVRLAGGVTVWLDGQFLRPGAAGPPRSPLASAVRVEERHGESAIVVAAPEPLPYLVEQSGNELHFTVFGAVAGAGSAPSAGYVARITTEPRDGGALRATATVRGPILGYDVRWRAGAMELRLRQPPAVDTLRPLAGLTIVVDAGHPPGGAVGPTGLSEPVVTLDVARRVEELLRARGARVVMTRVDARAVTLDARVAATRAAEGHAFVSLHADAIASGADPAREAGTAVYAYRAHSAPLAMAVQQALTAQLGLPDRGARRGDYAVVRTSWMPAVLCEGATMTIPEQEAALAHPAFRQAYALGVAEGLERYFRKLGRPARR